MNRTLSICLISLVSISCLAWTIARTKWKPASYEVSGSIMTTHDYCGGAYPGEDQIHPKPYAVKGTMLYILRTSTSRIVDSAITDSAGNFKVKLIAGEYCFVEKWKTEKLVMPIDTKFETWDTACYRQQYNKCEYSLRVTGKTTNVKIILRRYCAWSRPCCSYHGPMPPSAPPVNRGGNQPGHQEFEDSK